MVKSANALAAEIQGIWDGADREDRALTSDERSRVERLIDETKGQKAIEQKLAELGGSGLSVALPGGRGGEGGPGDRFVESEGYKAIRDPQARGSSWSTGSIEVPSYKATLLEGDMTSPGDGAALVQPDTRPGVVSILFEQLTVADLLSSAPTTSNTVRVVVETVATNAAATVAEGGDKPESTLEFDEVDEPVRKIATFLPVSDEMLEDAPQLRGYLNGRLTLFVRQEEEDQLLNGAGAGSDLVGLLDRVPVGNQDIESDAVAANAVDHIFAGITKAQESFLTADGIVVNTDDWAEIRLLKDSDGNYLAGSPFSNGQPQPGETLFGRRVVVTSAIPAGTALVGAFKTAATTFRRGALTVEASNSHADFFKKNLTAIRAEERLALAVYRPQAFATVATGTVGS